MFTVVFLGFLFIEVCDHFLLLTTSQSSNKESKNLTTTLFCQPLSMNTFLRFPSIPLIEVENIVLEALSDESDDTLSSPSRPATIEDSDVLLNDRHAPRITRGSEAWLDAKVEERIQNISRTLSDRVKRVAEIFEERCGCKPRFWLKVDNMKGSTTSGRIFAKSRFGKHYELLEGNDARIKDNIRNFRLGRVTLNTT